MHPAGSRSIATETVCLVNEEVRSVVGAGLAAVTDASGAVALVVDTAVAEKSTNPSSKKFLNQKTILFNLMLIINLQF